MRNVDQFQSSQCCATSPTSGFLSDVLPLLLVLLAIGWFYSRRNLISGTAKVISGNRISVGKENIRIYAMYGLFLGQPWRDKNGVVFDGGIKSKTALAHKIDGRRVKCWYQPKGGSAPGAKVCRVYLDGEDIGRWMVRNGYAVADIHPVRRNVYLRQEKRARRKRLGIHQGKFLHPWIWYMIVKQRRNERVRQILSQIENQRLEDDDISLDEAFGIGVRILRFFTDSGITDLLESAELIGELIAEA